MEITIFKHLTYSKDVPFHYSLDKVIDRIKNGKSAERVAMVRNSTNQKDKDFHKKKLPCILFNGVFTERNSSSLTKHSGLMVVDFDKYPDMDTMYKNLEILKQNKHFVLLFISPSGKGIKGVVKVSANLDQITHPKVFHQFQEDFNFDYWDSANSNVDRVCFESYDPNIYVNFDAEIYDPIIKDKGYSVQERTPLIPINDEEKIIEKIMQWNWKKDFREGERNSFIFDLAGAFCEYGISQNTAEGYILNNVVIGDFSDKEAITTIKSAYKKRNFDSKFFEDYQKIEKVKADLKKGKKEVIQKYGISEGTFEEIKEVQEHDDFWFINEKNKPQIDLFKYKLFLERNGFKKFFPEGCQKPTWVNIISNRVTETSVEKIKDFVLEYLLKRGEVDVWKYCANYPNLFSDKLLLMLDSINLMMLRDSKTQSFFAFQNGILEVDKNTKKLIDYIDIDGYVWESQIIQREWESLETFDNEYQTFINNISNGEPTAIECSIGYLLSTYKNKMNNKAIILNDEVISQNPEGGTGKGLFVQGLKQIRKVSILDGKTFDDKKSFPYQTVSPETQVLVFDDVLKNFNFENKFSLVTEGMTLERKNKDAIKLKVEDSPKMVISTNYAIKGEGNSHDRRRHELEIAQYYGKNLTPYDEFGKQLFDDWDNEDFKKFDNYMISCLQYYFKLGLVKQNAKNIKLRKFIAETNMDFYEWISDTSNFPQNVRNDKAQYFTQFINDNKDFTNYLKRNTFNIWINKYANFIGANFEQGNSNGLKWFGIFEKNFESKEENDEDFIF
jgi:hypothetical protein